VFRLGDSRSQCEQREEGVTVLQSCGIERLYSFLGILDVAERHSFGEGSEVVIVRSMPRLLKIAERGRRSAYRGRLQPGDDWLGVLRWSPASAGDPLAHLLERGVVERSCNP
jgi:hypothetical protein